MTVSSYTRRAEDGAIAHNAHYTLSYKDAAYFGGRSVRKRLRSFGIKADDMYRAALIGDQTLKAEFDYKIIMPNNRWAEVKGVVNASFIQLYCNGPEADEIVARVNAALDPYQKDERSFERARRAFRRQESVAKRRRKKKKAHRPRPDRQVQQPKAKKVFVQAPISLKHNEQVTSQFTKRRLLLRDMLTAVEIIFNVAPTEKRTAHQIIAGELSKSAKNSGGTFAQFKRRGFCLRFNFVGEYREYFTPGSISCTKDRGHESYKAMRAYFKEFFYKRSTIEQSVLRTILTRAANDNLRHSTIAA